MSTDLILGSNQPLAIPTYLQGADLGVSKDLLATAGLGGNRIGFKGNRFRIVVNGKEEGVVEENYLDVIVVGAVPHISRIYYEGAYDSDTKASPSCYSADGIAPPEDVKNRQAAKCDICPQNQLGSKIINGKKIKACAYFQRLVVMIAGDDTGTLYRVDVKAMGLFGDSKPAANKYNLRDYTKLVSNRGVDVAALITRLSFDIDSSVPKLLFAPVGFITAEQYAIVSTKVGSDETNNMLKISMQTVDLSGEVDAAAEATPAATPGATVEETPIETPAPQDVTRCTDNGDGTLTTPKGARIRMTQKAADEGFTYDDFADNGWTAKELVDGGYAEVVAKPAPPKPASTKPTPPAKPAAPAKPATPAKPAATATPAPTPRPAAPTVSKGPTVVKSAPPPPAQEPVVEVNSDAEIDDILAGLD